MKHYELTIPNGDRITNCTAPNGTAFPSNPNDGELFFHEGDGNTSKGMYRYNTNTWLRFNGPQILDDFDDVDTTTTAPVTDDALSYDGTNWVPKNKTDAFVPNRSRYIATQGQTTFNHDYSNGEKMGVFLNGHKLVYLLDFTASDGTTIVLSSGANSGDVVEIFGYGALEIDHYLKSEIDRRVLPDMTDVSDDASSNPNSSFNDGEIRYEERLRYVDNDTSQRNADRWLTTQPYQDNQYSNIIFPTGRIDFALNSCFVYSRNGSGALGTDVTGDIMDNYFIDDNGGTTEYTVKRGEFTSDFNAEWGDQYSIAVEIDSAFNDNGVTIRTNVPDAHLYSNKPVVISWRSKGNTGPDAEYKITFVAGGGNGETVMSSGTFTKGPFNWRRWVVGFTGADCISTTTDNPYYRIEWTIVPGDTTRLTVTNVQFEQGYVPSQFEYPMRSFEFEERHSYYQFRNSINNGSTTLLGVARATDRCRFPLIFHPRKMWQTPSPVIPGNNTLKIIDPSGTTYNVTSITLSNTNTRGEATQLNAFTDATNLVKGTPVMLTDDDIWLEAGYFPA